MAILSNRYARNTDFSAYQTLRNQINSLIVHSLKEVSSSTQKQPHILEFTPEKQSTKSPKVKLNTNSMIMSIFEMFLLDKSM